jgi:pimeloyl-ACP methyl ester carboxylesterase
MSHKPHILYLHGLGSGPASQKGVLVREHFSPRGYTVSLPSVTVPNLEALSPRAAVDRVKELVAQHRDEGLILMGSSFGAFLALHAYHESSYDVRAHIQALVLLAPALNPWDSASGLLTPERERLWRERGSAPVVNLETGVEVPVHYRFVEELRLFDTKAVRLELPTLIVHGLNDEVVPVAQSKEFAALHPGVVLEVVPDSHQLLGEPSKMLNLIERFILSGSTSSH